MTALWIVLALAGWTLIGLPFAVLLGRHADRHGRADAPVVQADIAPARHRHVA